VLFLICTGLIEDINEVLRALKERDWPQLPLMLKIICLEKNKCTI
jgi:hypothetical protein